MSLLLWGAALLFWGAQAPENYRLRTTPCPEAGLEGSALEAALSLELLPERLTRSATVAATELRVAARPCRSEGARYFLTLAGRSVVLGELDDLPYSGRSTALALLIVERLRDPARPLSTSEVVVVARARPHEASLWAAGALRTSGSGSWQYGPRIGAGWRPWAPWLAFTLALGATFGTDQDPLGEVDSRSYTARIGFQWERGGDWRWAVGPRIELGVLSLSGKAIPGAAARQGTAGLALSTLEGCLTRRLGAQSALGLCLEAGYVLSGRTAQADDRTLGGLEGWTLGASLGIGLDTGRTAGHAEGGSGDPEDEHL